MNITLAIDEKVAEEARRVAQAMGKSLNQLVREYLEQLAGQSQFEAELEELRSQSGRGDSSGEKLSRDAIYASRTGSKRRRA